MTWVMNTRYGRGWLLVLLLIASVWLVNPVQTADVSRVAAAAQAGDLAAVRALIVKHTDVNAPQADGSTALLWAAYNNDVPMTKALLAAGAKVDLANRYGVTPLLQASRTGAVAVMEALLKAGAKANQTHDDAETPLMGAARAGNVDAVKLLVVNGAEVNVVDAFQNQSALMYAAAEGHLPVVKTLLEIGADPNLKGHVTSISKRELTDHPTGGFTALMYAARNGHDDIVQTLIEKGADPNLTNGDSATAMTIAIVNDRLDLAAKMLDWGADADDGSLYHAVDMHDATTDMRARDGSMLRWDHPNKMTAMDLIQLLLDRGADPNKPFVGQLHSTSMCCGDNANGTPFYRAAIASDVAVLKLMLDYGANLEWVPVEQKKEEGAQGNGGGRANANIGKTAVMVTMRGGRGAAFGGGPGFDREGPPPFREAANRKPADALKLLLDAGADPDAKAPDGSYVIHQAVDAADIAMIRTLADYGATLDLKNKDGKTALELAEKKVADAAKGGGRGGAPAGMGAAVPPGRGPRGAKPEEIVAVLRELMGLPPAEAAPAAPADDPKATDDASKKDDAKKDDASKDAPKQQANAKPVTEGQ